MTSTIIKRLAFFPSFRKAIVDYALSNESLKNPDVKLRVVEVAFNSQSKPFRENLVPAFHDSNGKLYYKYPDYKNIPVKRLEQITKMQEVIKEGMKRGKGTYLADWIETGKLTIEKSKSPKADFAKLLYALEERSRLFDENLLLELLSLNYIREDENPNEFSESLHNDKITQITKDLKGKAGGLYDFFQQAGFKEFLPSGVGTGIDYEAFTKSSQLKIQQMTQELQKTTSLLNALKE